VARGPLPWTIVRATQFHELVAGFFGAAARYGVVPAPRGVLQPIAAADAAHAVADAALGEPRRGRVEVAGPGVVPIGDLAATWRRAAGRRALLVPLPVPGRVGRALRDGWLTAARPDVRGSITFATWASS
jgi:uncharacterized protein YbjT (DUF2867 family)